MHPADRRICRRVRRPGPDVLLPLLDFGSFGRDSPIPALFAEALCDLHREDSDAPRKLLRFATGLNAIPCSSAPFKLLVVPDSYATEGSLPTASTYTRQLRLPTYIADREVLCAKLKQALEAPHHSFEDE